MSWLKWKPLLTAAVAKTLHTVSVYMIVYNRSVPNDWALKSTDDE